MKTITTNANYETNLESAINLIQQSVKFTDAGGNMSKWACDSLNNEWSEGITIEQWVAQSITRINHGQ